METNETVIWHTFSIIDTNYRCQQLKHATKYIVAAET